MRDFAKYIKKFDKHYSVEEFPIRFENFKGSVQRIEEENKNSLKTKYALNKFSGIVHD